VAGDFPAALRLQEQLARVVAALWITGRES
jgi:hypothetical protein